MSKKRQVVCLICCREGSVRLKNKNIINFLRKPLLSYIYQNIIKSKVFDRVILSTDGKKIADFGKKIGFEVPGLRPKNLSKAKSNVFDTHKYIFNKLNINDKNSIVCIINNNPFIKENLIKKTFEIYKKNKYKFITTLALKTSTDQLYFKQFKNVHGRLIPLFKKDIIKSPINSNQIKNRTFYNLGEVRWAKTNLLSSFEFYNKDLIKNGNKFTLINENKYIDIHNIHDLRHAEKLYQINYK